MDNPYKIVPNVLIVDDVNANIVALKALLKGFEINIYETTSPNEALALTLKHDFALILLDVQMPEMSGYEVAEYLQGIDRTKHIPIIFLTANARSEENEVKGFEVGGVDYLTKPINRTVLLSKIKTFLSIYVQKETLKKMNIDLKVAHLNAEKSSRAKGNFLTTMSHEFRTPLNGILGMMQLLETTKLDSEQMEWLDIASRSGEHLLLLLGDILDLSKLEEGNIKLEIKEFDLQQLISDSVNLFVVNAREKGVKILIDICDEMPKWVMGDYLRLRQIVINLIGNALKFTDKGQIVIKAELNGINNKEVTLGFEIIDSGIGIPPDKTSYIFNKFTQVDENSNRKYGGTGLGLAICKELVELMGGNIGVHSQLGNGSTFWFDIKLELSDKFDTIPVFDPKKLAGKHVLIVMHNLKEQEIIKGFLARWGLTSCAIDNIGLIEQQCDLIEKSANQLFAVIIDHHLILEENFALFEKILPKKLENIPVVLTHYRDKVSLLHDQLLNLIADKITKPVLPLELHYILDKIADRQVSSVHSDENKVKKINVEDKDINKDIQILVVDDIKANQLLLAKVLERMGYKVEVADNGVQALEKVKCHEFRMIFMDCNMPEMDGFEATRIIRKNENGPHLPIVAVTADVMQGDREKCINAGMDDYVSKPFRIDRIKEMLGSYVHSS
jgi:CheY-like chemotaxis protein